MADQPFEISQAAGIIRDAQGFAFIPASQRPDGTWRKARKVKEGYVPEEDVARYKNKAARSRANAPVCPGLTSQPQSVSLIRTDHRQTLEKLSSGTNESIATSGIDSKSLSKSARKNLKRKELRSKKKEEEVKASLFNQYEAAKSESSMDNSIKTINEKLEGVSISKSPIASNDHPTPSNVVDTEKRLKNLRKKLRQIKDLKDKIESGLLPNPDKMQLEKVAKEDEIEQEIFELERQ